MYKINNTWSKFVTGVINNIGWIIVITLAAVALLFTQLGTKHKEEGMLTDIYNSFEQYGKISGVYITNGKGDTVSIRKFYTNKINDVAEQITELRQKAKEYLEVNGTNSSDDDAYIDIQNEIEAATAERNRYFAERELISSGVLKGLSLDSRINQDGEYRLNWKGEYTLNKIIYLVSSDVYSWMLALIIGISAIITKIQGSKTGKNSGLKMVWKTTLRHATLSEKIAPRSRDAEQLCQVMNKDELRSKREERLRYVALRYDDVFTEEGVFLNNPNFTKVEIMVHKSLNGKIRYIENKYQRRLLRKQKREVERLKKLRIKEVHTYILLESKAEAKERFDFGLSLEARERRTLIKNILTSLITVLPMFGAVSLFVYTGDKTGLLVGVVGVIFNFVSLLVNMFSSYDYIINTWTPGILKKCDTLLVIGNQLGLTDETDNTWEATVEKELIAASKKN